MKTIKMSKEAMKNAKIYVQVGCKTPATLPPATK